MASKQRISGFAFLFFLAMMLWSLIWHLRDGVLRLEADPSSIIDNAESCVRFFLYFSISLLGAQLSLGFYGWSQLNSWGAMTILAADVSCILYMILLYFGFVFSVHEPKFELVASLVTLPLLLFSAVALLFLGHRIRGRKKTLI